MLCYKDMTFCEFYTDCAKGKKCHRALTPKIAQDAKNFGLPTSRFVDKPECFKEVEPGMLKKWGLDKEEKV